MINIILALLILPFVPVWSYGDFSDILNKNLIGEQTCNQGGSDVCGLQPDSSSGFSNYSLFPVDRAFASGLVPIRTNNYPDIILWSGAAVAIDADSGTILHYENGRKRTQVASLTKMMTAILAVENINDLSGTEITMTKEYLDVAGTVVGCPSPTTSGCTSNRLYVGEKVKAIDLMKAMLMNSANDAATALGGYVAGNPKSFVEMMNKKAKELGLKDTHFCTPSGLEIDGQEDQCYSTAYDIARIAAYSLQYDIIWDIMKIPDGRFYSCDGKYMHELKNTDALLDTLPNCIGGKTGFTPMAGKSLLLGATDDTRKHKIIAVVLNDENRWENMRTLVSWIFDNYKWQ